MFLGTHSPRMDEKGRLIFPAKFRERLASGLVVTKGQERCLYVYPSDHFAGIAANLSSAPTSSKPVRDYVRVILSAAYDEIPDKQGRITIPAPLRAYAGLDRDLVVIGMGDRIEIWDSAAWATYLAESEQTFAEQSEEIIPGLF